MATLAALIRQYKDDMTSGARIACATVATKVVSRTPVDTGHARKHWSPALNGADTGNLSSQITAICNSMKAGDSFHLTSAVPYIRRLEYDGHSPQAPAGMMRISILEWSEIVRRAFAN